MRYRRFAVANSSVRTFHQIAQGALTALAVLSLLACGQEPSAEPGGIAPAPAEQKSQSPGKSPARPGRLRIDGTRFVAPDNRTFEWRGITAFRLVDYVADGDEQSATRFLDWASAQKLTVVRVLTMMSGLFDLQPVDGRRALPRLLELAAARGLYVEVVALANTFEIPVDLAGHIEAIGKILARHPNAVLEIANEPVHPTQSAEVHQPGVLKGLAARVPNDIPVSLGSIERGDGFGAGTYITWHSPRESGRGGWAHVLALSEGAELLSRWKKPVVNDEPIGAGPQFLPGRRDDAPARFRAAGLATRLTGLGATFHYDGGIQARVPEGRELECFNAWNEAWTLLPPDVERHGTFISADSSRSALRPESRAKVAGVFERAGDARAYVLVVGDPTAVVLAQGWTASDTRAFEGAGLITAERGPD